MFDLTHSGMCLVSGGESQLKLATSLVACSSSCMIAGWAIN